MLRDNGMPYLYNAFPSDLMPGGDIKPGDTLETRIYPTRISGFPMMFINLRCLCGAYQLKLRQLTG